MSTDLSDLNLDLIFPHANYAFAMRFQQRTLRDFFGPTPTGGRLLEQRRHWLRSAPQTYAAALPTALPLLNEARHLFSGSETISPAQAEALGRIASPSDRCIALGEMLEPDILLLQPRSNGEFHLDAAAVCFPSSWVLAEKIGRPIHEIHGVVPGLNAAIGRQIGGFLSRLRPGISWERANWGLSRSPELNQHPERKLPRLEPGISIDEIWMRVEHQSLVALPESGGVLFGIRLFVQPLREFARNKTAAQRLARHLESMPADVAEYKNLATARPTILRHLGALDP